MRLHDANTKKHNRFLNKTVWALLLFLPHTATHCNTLQRTATHCNSVVGIAMAVASWRFTSAQCVNTAKHDQRFPLSMAGNVYTRHIYTYMYKYIYTHIYVCINIYTHIHICMLHMYTNIYTQIYICMYILLYMYVYIYIYVYTHIYENIYT